MSPIGAHASPGDKTSPATYVPTSEKGAALGVATLDSASKILPAQLPDFSATYVGKESQAINVKDYGAKGDSITDDYSAITAAIAGCPLGSTLFFPQGTYMTSREILLNRNINLLGVGISRNSGTRLNSGSIIRFTSNAAQNAATALLRVTASFGDIESIALFGRGSAQGSKGLYYDDGGVNTNARKVLVEGFGAGIYQGFHSNHNHFDSCLVSGNVDAVVFGAGNCFDFSYIACNLTGNTNASVRLEGDAGVVNVTFFRCHLGFGPYGIVQDATLTGNGYAGLTLIDSPIEYVSQQHINIVNGGNIRIEGGYWVWNGTPANPAFQIRQVNSGPIYFTPRLEQNYPNPNSPAVIQVDSYTNYTIHAETPLNGFAVALLGGQFKSPKVQTFMANGTYTVPAGVTVIQVSARGGGGGGGGGGSALTAGGVSTQVGGAGGAAGGSTTQTLAVLPGQTYVVTIGGGGAGGAGATPNGNAGNTGSTGGNTNFTGPGGTVFAKGGGAGGQSAGNSTVNVNGAAYGYPGQTVASGSQTAGCGGVAVVGTGRSGGDSSGGYAGAGGGAGGSATATLGGGLGSQGGTTIGGPGGASGASATANGQNGGSAAGNSGAGGGGGGGGAPGGAGGNGGNGSPGCVLIVAIA